MLLACCSARRNTSRNADVTEGSLIEVERAVHTRPSVEGGNNAMETSSRPIASAAATRENGVVQPYQKRPSMIYRLGAFPPPPKELMEAK